MKSIVRFLLTAILIIFVTNSYAQQLPAYNLYTHMKIINNPANTADDGYVSAFLDARNQWTGIIGAPKTRTFGMQGAINDHMRLGGFVADDKYGLIEKLSANLSYAYLVKLNEDHQLTFGLAAIINENSFNLSDAKVGDYNDVVLTMSNVEGVNFDAGFGFKYNWKKLELGVSVPQIIETKIKYTSPEDEDYFFDLRRHFNLFLGYYINPTNKRIAFEPSIMYRSARKSPTQLDLNLLTYWDQKYWLGLAYRNSGRTWVESANGGDYKEINLSLANSYFILSGGLRVMNNLELGYAYEISNSHLYAQSNGTHELMLVYTFGAKSREEMRSDVEMDLLKKSQKELLSKVDNLDNKLDKNIQNTDQINDIVANNNQTINELANKVEGIPDQIEFKGDTAGVYALISKIDQLNKKLSDMDDIDNKQQELLDELNNEIAILRGQLSSKTGGDISPQVSIPLMLTGDQNTVYFKTGSSVLNYDARIKLQRMLIYINQNKTAKIQINGFTDEVGDEASNKTLSDERAQVVYNYLVSNGVELSRLSTSGHGETKPLVSNKTYEGRALNRRTEVIIIK